MFAIFQKNKLTKTLLLMFIFLMGLSFLWFDFVFVNRNNDIFKERMASAANNGDVIIIFNPGGFGTVDFEKAYDFKPIIDNIKSELESKGERVVIVPYNRTEPSLLGYMAYPRELLFNFSKQSDYLASQIDDFVRNNPNDKIIMAGLSNGAAFVNSTMEKVSSTDNVLAVELGNPFWANSQEGSAENILKLNNNNQDSLSVGNIYDILISVFKSPFIFIGERIKGNNISYAEAIKVTGHDYEWKNIKDNVAVFLDNSLKKMP